MNTICAEKMTSWNTDFGPQELPVKKMTTGMTQGKEWMSEWGYAAILHVSPLTAASNYSDQVTGHHASSLLHSILDY